MKILSQAKLKELLKYYPETGELMWIKSRVRGKVITKAGCVSGDGYRRIEILGKNYLAHRLAFLFMTGSFPDNDMDHIDGNKDNNIWSNLRAVSTLENCRNQKLLKNNTSGYPGIHWSKETNKWRVRIGNGIGRLNIGLFDNLLDAVAARKSAEIEYNYHPNHGSIR